MADGQIAVLAGSRIEFEKWIKENPAKAGRRVRSEYEHAFYAHDEYSIEGRMVSEIVCTGSAEQRRNHSQLLEMVRQCQLCSRRF